MRLILLLILGACSRYIQEKLIDGNHRPDWREMDTLADAIAGVEYYLETLDQDVIEEEDSIKVELLCSNSIVFFNRLCSFLSSIKQKLRVT